MNVAFLMFKVIFIDHNLIVNKLEKKKKNFFVSLNFDSSLNYL